MITKQIAKYDIASPSQMEGIAKTTQQHIEKYQLFTNIVGKKYVHVEGLQFAAARMQLFTRISKIENLSTDKEKKWMAESEVVRFSDGEVVGRGFAICSNLESKKRSFDEYAVLSMSQTRANGRALRNVIGWLLRMTGYESTVSEEIVKMDGVSTVPVPKQETPKYLKPTKFELSKKWIEQENDIEVLKEKIPRIEKATELTDAQKFQLKKLINQKIDANKGTNK